MRRVVYLAVTMLMLAFAGQAEAQQQSWIQIEARPNLRQAQDRARAYATAFGNVAGFALTSGWYAIVLGPYSDSEARDSLQQLRRDRMIPSDSYVVDGSEFRRQYWPIGANAEPPSAAQPGTDQALPQAPATTDQQAQGSAAAPLPSAAPDTQASAAPAGAPDQSPEESLAEARQGEAQLDGPARERLQEALKWEGYYNGAIDGAFGPGTRGSMSDWQSAKGYQPTGVLTTAQRQQLLGSAEKEQAALGLQTVTDEDAGIRITLPTAMIGSPTYDPPFAHYDSKNGSGVRVLLISEPGDQAALAGLYRVMQTLQVVPMTGERALNDNNFTISGSNGEISSYTYVALDDGLIKGYTLVWKPQDAKRMDRVLAAMKASFRPIGKAALDGSMVPTPADQRRDLLNGLEVRKPAAARTGFFVSQDGVVLTTSAVLKSCGRITVGAGHAARVLHEDKSLGIALLKPEQALAPRAVARFEGPAPRVGDPAAVAGFSYGGVLTAPVMTYGTLEGLTGLQGQNDLRRLSLKALPGDAGGPVFDHGGAVIGMLLPRAEDEDGKQLPDNVRYVLDAAALASSLKAAGLTPATGGANDAMAPEDLATLGSDTAVLVRCWK